MGQVTEAGPQLGLTQLPAGNLSVVKTEIGWPPLSTPGLLRVDPLSPFRLDVGMAHGAGEGPEVLQSLECPQSLESGWEEGSIAWHRS